MTEPCAIHDVVMSGLDNRIKSLEDLLKDNSTKLDTILATLAGLATADASTAVKVKNLKESDEKQWKEIDSLRRLVYVGVGVASALSFLVPWIMNLVMKP